MKRRVIAMLVAAVLAVPVFASAASGISCSKSRTTCWRYPKPPAGQEIQPGACRALKIKYEQRYGQRATELCRAR